MGKKKAVYSIVSKVILFLIGVVCAFMLISYGSTFAHTDRDQLPEEEVEVTNPEATEPEPTEYVYEATEPEPEQTEYVSDEPWPDRVVFLTFDDGPGLRTHTLLDVLYEHDVPAIFFLLGQSMTYHPDNEGTFRRILDEGHYIGLHSMSHNYNALYRAEGAVDRFVSEMLQLQEIIYDLVGHHTNLCRAPFGMMSGFVPDIGHAQAVEEAGIKCIDWNVDPRDWENTADLILSHVINQVEMMNYPSELVIVLHERLETIEALPAIIAYLRSHGYVFKTYTPGYEFNYMNYRNRLHNN